MHVINIHKAKTHLSKLIDKAVQGESFIIAKAGKPLVKVTAIASDDIANKKFKHLGFMLGQINIPNDFDQIGSEEIEKLFNGDA